MPRQLLKKITPAQHTLREHWFFRRYATWLSDPALWSFQRRSVTSAFGVGLAICFVPLPMHVPLAILMAVLWRLNIAATVAATFIVNPVTVVPAYYVAYRVGAFVVGESPTLFHFEPSWEWLRNGLGPAWKPFLVGCVICGVLLGIAGRLALDALWRWRVKNKYRGRNGASSS